MASLPRVVRMALAAASALMGSPAAARVDRPADWVGRRVMIRFGTVLHVGDLAVDDQRLDVSPRGRRRRVVRVYRVEKTEGDRLWLRAERGGARGWVPAGEVVPLDAAVALFSEELRAQPDDAPIYLDRAAARADAGDYLGAVSDCDVAIRLDPTNEVAYVCRGNFRFLGPGDIDAAAADFDEAIRLDPGYALAYYSRGFAAALTGDLDRALTDLAEATRLDPRDPIAPRARAWLLAIWPDPSLRDAEAAVASATRACELTDWSDAPSLAALAAALAEAGDFDAAASHQEKAASLRPEGPARVESLRRLALYRDRTTYRDAPGGPTPA